MRSGHLTTSVLVPSFRRPEKLARCLEALASQTRAPDEVVVVWQGDDVGTEQAARQLRNQFPFELRILHSPCLGIVPAENLALLNSNGEIVMLIDDDAVAFPEWLNRHIEQYADPATGAVGGPADNYDGGRGFPKRAATPIGRTTWYGRSFGNLYDHPPEWRLKSPLEVDHLAGFNMSIRRHAFDRFENALKPYWQGFEADACLQVKANGYKVLFDFANVVRHYPSNTVYASGRDGDLQQKVYNAAFNEALILGKHTARPLRKLRLAYLLIFGAVNTPGLVGCLVAIKRYGMARRELRILMRTWQYHIDGWCTGSRLRYGRAVRGE